MKPFARYNNTRSRLSNLVSIMNEVTVIITPRDRYSGLDECISNLYDVTDSNFNLIILDLGYPKSVLKKAKKITNNRENVSFVSFGLIPPMAALEKIRGQISTKYSVLLDNDSRLTRGWLSPLISAADDKAVIVSPLILEKEGVDEGAALRNHLHSCDIRVISHDDHNYLIEDKKYRRVLPYELPVGVQSTDTFELHCVLFLTKHLQAIEIPQMVVREHIDIGLQTRAMGKSIVVQPDSIVLFDNLGTRMNLADMKYFFFRWNKNLTKQSHILFEKRWGYRFYAEKAMYVWVFRRKVFLISRFIHMPIWISNKLSGLFKRLFCKDWDPVKDPIKDSLLLRDVIKDQEIEKV